MGILKAFLSSNSSNDYMPHGYCYLWNAKLVWLHVISDSLIALAYLSIPVTLVYFIRKRRDVPFNWVFVCFGAFILACGGTHLMEVWTLWHANYWLSGTLKAVTAVTSVGTAILLVRLIPQALALPRPEALRREIVERQRAQEALQNAKQDLELRVRQRTAELTNANQVLLVEVAQRKQTEEELRRTEERFRLLIESVQDYAIFMLSTAGIVTSWNAGAQRMKGYEAEEIIGQHFSRFYLAEDLERGKPKMELDVAAAEGRFVDEAWRRRRDGSRFWASIVITALRDAHGKLIGFSKITRDLSERRLAEEEQRKLASLVENSSDFIGLAALEGQVLFVNPAGLALVGLEGDEQARTTTILDYVVREDQEKMMQQVLPIVMRDGHWEGEIQFRHFKTGKAISMHQHIFFAGELGSERRLALATVSRDITERKLAEEALRAAQGDLAHVTRVTTMGELTASIAHEINQPLSAIVNNANACRRLLAVPSPDLDEVRQAVTDIADLGTRAGEVISRIRAFMKKAIPMKAQVDLNQVIVEVLALIPAEMATHKIAVVTELSPGLPPVLGDRIQLQQVLLNLIMNGIESMTSSSDRPRVLLIRSQTQESGHVLVAVQDSGTGLDAKAMSHIFDTFFTTKAAGMGMGLAISRSIVEAHGGRLWPVPDASEGAIFNLTLPVCA
jgi:PAS domain S-box-containing protein